MLICVFLARDKNVRFCAFTDLLSLNYFAFSTTLRNQFSLLVFVVILWFCALNDLVSHYYRV